MSCNPKLIMNRLKKKNKHVVKFCGEGFFLRIFFIRKYNYKKVENKVVLLIEVFCKLLQYEMNNTQESIPGWVKAVQHSSVDLFPRTAHPKVGHSVLITNVTSL